MTEDSLATMATTAFDVFNWARREGMKKDQQIEQVVAAFKMHMAEWYSEIGRFVAVRWTLPDGTEPVVEIYDRKNPGDLEAWDRNQQLYPMQIIGWAVERSVLKNDPNVD